MFNKLTQVDVAIPVLITLPKNLIHDFRTVIHVHIPHLQKTKHLVSVDLAVMVGIQLLKLLSQLDFLLHVRLSHFFKLTKNKRTIYLYEYAMNTTK